jgi:hypothetical protein
VQSESKSNCPYLLGGEFFLFAFHAHGFELALFRLVGFHDLGLDLGCRFDLLPEDVDGVEPHLFVAGDEPQIFGD